MSTAVGADTRDPTPPNLNAPSNGAYKSYRKKYNKMRHKFKEVTTASSRLFEEEQRLQRVARRLQQKNDQLLDLLLSVNESRRLPLSLHYDIRSPTPSETAVPPLEEDNPSSRFTYSAPQARSVLQEAKDEFADGKITQADFTSLVTSLRSSLGSSKALRELSKIPHSSLPVVAESKVPVDLFEEPLNGFLDPAYEEEYLAALDTSIDPQPLRSDAQPLRGAERFSDQALKNPVSVYNWLRRYQPHMLDEAGSPDKEPKAAAETPAAKQAATRREAKSRKTAVQEVLDDEGFVINAPAESTRGGKRKRDDEPYRPKGGSGTKSKRRKTAKGGGEAVEE